MGKTRKSLKELSILILILAAISFVRSVVDALLEGVFHKGEIPEGMTEGLLLASAIIVCILSLVLLLPEIYIGIKGIKIAKNPDSSKAHIVWAIILGVLSAIAIFSPISSLIKGGDILGDVLALINAVVNVIIYFGYAVYARRILKGE